MTSPTLGTGAASVGKGMALEITKPKLVKENGLWVIRIDRPNGKTQEYRCATEAQARQLQIVLTPPPEQAPS